MENGKYLASCPICGTRLFKGISGSVNEVFCPKCKINLEVKFGSRDVTVLVLSETRNSISPNSSKDIQTNSVC